MLRLVFSCSSVYPTIDLGETDGHSPATHVKPQTIGLSPSMTVSIVKASLVYSMRALSIYH